MYCLRVLLFYRYMDIVCYSVYCDYFGVLIDCCVSELHAKLCPHRNVWPEIVDCCFTRTTLFTELFRSELARGFYHFTKFHCSTPSSTEIVK